MKPFHLFLLAGALGLSALSAAGESDVPVSPGVSGDRETFFPVGYTAPRMSVGNGSVAIVGPMPIFGSRPASSTSTGITRIRTGANGGGGGAVQPVVLQDGNTELMQAATTGDTARVRQLLAGNANANARNRYGSTALMGAAAGGYLEIVNLLLAQQADPNAKGRGGSTALMFAARNGHADTVAALVKAGADPALKDGEGKTASTLAFEQGFIEIAQTLKTSTEPSTSSNP